MNIKNILEKAKSKSEATNPFHRTGLVTQLLCIYILN